MSRNNEMTECMSMVMNCLSLMSDAAEEARDYADRKIKHHEPFWAGYGQAVSGITPLLTSLTKDMVDDAALDVINDMRKDLRGTKRDLRDEKKRSKRLEKQVKELRKALDNSGANLDEEPK